MELRGAAAAHARGRGAWRDVGRDQVESRGLPAALPDPPSAAAGAADAGTRRRAADRRSGPRRRALRGLPAGVPGRVPGQHSRARHRARPGDAGHHPHQQPHARTQRCGEAALPLPLAGLPERERELAIVRAQVPEAGDVLSQQVAAFVGRLRSQPFAHAFQRAPGIAESVEWARALVALDTLELDPEVVADTAGILFKQRDDVAALSRELAADLLKPQGGGSDHAAGRRTQRQAGRQHHGLRPRLAPRRRAASTARASRWRSRPRTLVGVASKADLGAAMEAVMVSREQDRGVFRELFDAWFRDPELANKLLAQMLPSAEGKAEPRKRRPRVREALSPQQRRRPARAEDAGQGSGLRRGHDGQRPAACCKHADFNALGAAEYRLVERLARDVALARAVHARDGCTPAGLARRAQHALARRHAPCRAHRRRTAAAAAAARGARSRCPCWCWSMCRARWSAMRGCCWPFCMPPPAMSTAARAGATCSPSAPT